ncbi:uncharacterized protein METZ01_LOCUS316127 [marine metagenome]|uniref:Uncharacterized protein n=1 Tax=marine metagenome TaxID=408172 RepID=A0A382NQ29_9ZZZZ
MAKRKKQPYNGGGRELTLDEKLDWVIKVKEVKCTMMTGGGGSERNRPAVQAPVQEAEGEPQGQVGACGEDAGNLVRHSEEKWDQGASDEI